MRVRRNADSRIRRLERSVAGGGGREAEIALVRERLRAGLVTERGVRRALFFSASTSSSVFNWHPLRWEHNEIVAPAAEFTQDPRTLELNGVCQGVLSRGGRAGWWRSPPERFSDRTENWMAARGFGVCGTGGGGNHPPFEIQYDQNVERATEAESLRVEDRQLKIAAQFHLATGGDAIVTDGVFIWLVRRGFFAGRPNETAIMKFLRVHSTVEYCAVLGADVYGPWKGRPQYGITELRYVTEQLGGAPL